MGTARKLIAQTLWASMGQLFQAVTGLVSLIILVRILGPEAYGVFALGLLFTNLAEVVVGGHAADGIVQKQDLTSAQKTAAYAAMVAAGLLCTVILIVCSPFAAGLFDAPGLAAVLPAMAVLPLLTAASAVPNQLLVRDLRFSALAKISALAGLLAVGLGVAMALAGFGLWSLVCLELSRRLVLLLLLHVSLRWLPAAGFSLQDLHAMLRFAVRRIENRGLRYLSVDALPRVFIGYGLGAEALGYFVVARRFVDQLNGVLSGPVSAVSFPAAARLRSDPGQLERLIESIIRTSTWTFWPALLGTAIVAPLLVPLMFGDGWTASVVVLQLLAMASLRAPLSGHAASILTAFGAMGDISRIQIMAVIIGVIACAFGLQYGLVGIVAGLALRQWFVLPAITFFVGRRTGFAPLRQAGLALHAGVPALAMAAAILILGLVLRDALAPPLALAILVGTGIAVYLAAWLVWNDTARPSVLAALSGIRRGDRDAAARSLKAIIAP